MAFFAVLADKPNPALGEHGRVLVIQTTGLGSGRHSRTVWEWLRQKAENA